MPFLTAPTLVSVLALATLSPATPEGDVDALLAKLRTPASLRDDWSTFRVGGDLFAATDRQSDELFIAGPCRVTTPLPQGYPLPTPPGAVELKRYPAARRAEYASSGDSEFGRNIAFWPLFNHIKKHDIAMTSPVEMDFKSREAKVLGTQPDPKDKRWTMSFLYRTPDMNATGSEGKVTVTDVPAVSVIAVGTRGPYSEEALDDALNTLMATLATSPDWKPAGAPRALYYNGPDTAPKNLWGEIQIPITPTLTSTTPTAIPAPAIPSAGPSEAPGR